MTNEPACRCCGKNDALTYVYKADASGSLQRSSAVCRDGCFRAKPVSQQTDRQRYRSNPRGNVWTAIRPGRCPSCSWDIVPGDKIAGNQGSPPVHYACSEN